jgi:hypothetical protein
MDLKKIKDWFESEEAEKTFNDYIDKISIKDNIIRRQLEKLHKSGNFVQFTEKVVAKYNSNIYRDKWYNRGVEPPEYLLWFLFYYAKEYGRECNEDEWDKYSNMFSSNLFFCDGYYFNRMDGQGSMIEVIKQ